MFRKLFTAALFFGFIASAYSQEIDDLSKYISDIESKLSCPVKNVGQKVAVKDMFDRDASVAYGCPNNTPLLEVAVVKNSSGNIVLELSCTVFEGGEYVMIKTDYVYYDAGNLKSSRSYMAKYDKDGSFEYDNTTSVDYSSNAKKIKKVFVTSQRTDEETWEYFANGVVSKYTVKKITSKDKEESIIEYNETSFPVKETDIIFDVETSLPYKKSVTEYDPKSKKILSTVMYDYENGHESIKTLYSYEKGKLVSLSVYELMYDDQGNLSREKRIDKQVY